MMAETNFNLISNLICPGSFPKVNMLFGGTPSTIQKTRLVLRHPIYGGTHRRYGGHQMSQFECKMTICCSKKLCVMRGYVILEV